MRLHELFGSGKNLRPVTPHRRAGWPKNIYLKPVDRVDTGLFLMDAEHDIGVAYAASVEDFVADDWELFEP